MVAQSKDAAENGDSHRESYPAVSATVFVRLLTALGGVWMMIGENHSYNQLDKLIDTLRSMMENVGKPITLVVEGKYDTPVYAGAGTLHRVQQLADWYEKQEPNLGVTVLFTEDHTPTQRWERDLFAFVEREVEKSHVRQWSSYDRYKHLAEFIGEPNKITAYLKIITSDPVIKQLIGVSCYIFTRQDNGRLKRREVTIDYTIIEELFEMHVLDNNACGGLFSPKGTQNWALFEAHRAMTDIRTLMRLLTKLDTHCLFWMGEAHIVRLLAMVQKLNIGNVVCGLRRKKSPGQMKIPRQWMSASFSGLSHEIDPEHVGATDPIPTVNDIYQLQQQYPDFHWSVCVAVWFARRFIKFDKELRCQFVELCVDQPATDLKRRRMLDALMVLPHDEFKRFLLEGLHEWTRLRRTTLGKVAPARVLKETLSEAYAELLHDALYGNGAYLRDTYFGGNYTLLAVARHFM